VALLVEPAENSPDARPEQMQPAARADRVEAELALVEPLAFAEAEQIHLVAIVADEQQRRADRRLEPGRADPELVTPEVAERGEAGGEHRHALGTAQFLLLQLAQHH